MDLKTDRAGEREKAWYPTKNLPKRNLAFEIPACIIILALFMIGIAVSH